MHDAVIGLGSNLGSSAYMLEAAQALLARSPGLQVLQRSRLYLTPPLGPAQPDFHNAAVRVRWVGSAPGLLDLLLHVEARLGRERRERWGPRTVDLDLLWWGGGVVDTPRLRVPHPGLTRRSFALAPLLDVAPELRERYARPLVALGGAPREVAWPAPLRLSPEGVAGPFHDAAHALAAAAHCMLDGLPAPQGPLQVLPWNPAPDSGAHPTLCAALEAVRAPLRYGLSPCAAAVLEASATRWRGLLLAAPCPPCDPAGPHPPRLRLKKGEAGSAAWLTLLPESV